MINGTDLRRSPHLRSLCCSTSAEIVEEQGLRQLDESLYWTAGDSQVHSVSLQPSLKSVQRAHATGQPLQSRFAGVAAERLLCILG